MDITKVQRLNQLATNLRQHNIYNKEQAIAQAEEIYGRQHNYSQEKVHHPSNTQIQKDVRKMNFALQRAFQEIQDLKSTVHKLSKELNDARVNQTVSRPEASAPRQAPAPKDPNKPIDRNKVSPSEVAIEKYFYFGQN